MNKKGQGGEVVKYLIVAILIIVITFFGFNIITKVSEKSCKAELAKFEIGLKGLDKIVKSGSIMELTKQVPCKADRVYFFDLEADINLEFLSHLPLIRDSVSSKAENNVFVVKDDIILSSFYAGNLDISFPNHICFLPKFEKINFFIEGMGQKVSVVSGCLQPECTYIPEEATFEEGAAIIRDAAPDSCVNCPFIEPTQEFEFFKKAKENSQIFRKYEYCKETGQTNVEIIIRPNEGVGLETVRYYESIPKNCIDDLKNYLNMTTGGEVRIKRDPLIVWTLDDIRAEEKISYILDTVLSEECKEAISGIAIAEQIEEGKTAISGPSIDDFEEEKEVTEAENNRPTFSSVPDVTLRGLGVKTTIENLWIYADDVETQDQFLFYSVLSESRTDVVDCDISGNKRLDCDVKQVSGIGSSVVLQVRDPEGLTATAQFSVFVEPEVQTCAEQSGFICSLTEICTGIDLTATDTGRCCSVTCQTSTTNLCDDCGDGFFNLACDRNECESFSQACYFIDEFPPPPNVFGDCKVCAGAVCVDYDDDKKTCGDDPCSIGNCNWDGNECKTFCSPESSTICHDNDVYWEDSCGIRGNKKDECGTSTTTSDFQCSGNILQRKNINRGCSSGACVQSQVWVTEEICGAGKVCDEVSKSCVSATTCSDGTPTNTCSTATSGLFCNSNEDLVGGCNNGCGCFGGSGTCNTDTGFCDNVGNLKVCENDPFTNSGACPACNEKYSFSTGNTAVFLRYSEVPGIAASGSSNWYYWDGDSFDQVSTSPSGAAADPAGNCYAPVRGINSPHLGFPALKDLSPTGSAVGIWKAELTLNGNLKGSRSFKIE